MVTPIRLSTAAHYLSLFHKQFLPKGKECFVPQSIRRMFYSLMVILSLIFRQNLLENRKVHSHNCLASILFPAGIFSVGITCKFSGLPKMQLFSFPILV